MKSKRFSLINIIKYHKIIGICLAAWLLVMVVTGILLNHTNDLDLDQAPIQNKLILKAYGVKSPEQAFTHSINDTISIHQYGEHLFYNDKKLEGFGPIAGKALIVANDQEIFVCWDHHAILLTIKGELIEANDLFPLEDLLMVGMDKGQESIYLKTAADLYRGTSDDLEFSKFVLSDEIIQWQNPSRLTSQITETLSAQLTYKGFTWERLILDIHNGNIFGYASKYLIDLFSVFFLILILSGIYIWYKKLR